MKKPYIKSLGLFIIVLFAGLIFTSVKSSQKFQFSETAEELHGELIANPHHIDPAKAKALLAKQNKDYIFVDIRNPRVYDNFHIEGAINVPLQLVLDDEFSSFFKNSTTKVLYCDNSLKANQIRLLLTQYGYKNLLVLHGGANYWKEHMMSNDVFKSKGEFDDEKLNFDTKKLKASK